MVLQVDAKQQGAELIAAARDFAQKVILPTADEIFWAGEFPYETMARMKDLGYMGILASPEWGGTGVSTAVYMAMMEEIAKADMTVALTWQVHVLVTDVYEKFANKAQRGYWMPKLVSGEILGSAAMTEPGAGSDLRSIRTKAEPRDGGWVINGQKTFITNAGTHISDGLIVLAVSGTRSDGKSETSTFIVPKDTPGLVMGNKLQKIGWRPMDTREVFLEDCWVPEENLLGERGAGLRQLMIGLDLGRITFGAASTGLAQACLDHALKYAKERVQFGKPISQYQAIQFKLADMATKIAAARALVYEAARLRDAGLPCEMAASIAKLYATRAGVEVADEAYQIFGGYGTSMEYPIARYYLDAKLMEIGEGTNEIQRLYIARCLGC